MKQKTVEMISGISLILLGLVPLVTAAISAKIAGLVAGLFAYATAATMIVAGVWQLATLPKNKKEAPKDLCNNAIGPSTIINKEKT